MTSINPRRLYVDDKPFYGMESDRDFMENNREVCIAFLESEGKYPLHYHQAKYKDGKLTRTCNLCGKDLLNALHILG